MQRAEPGRDLVEPQARLEGKDGEPNRVAEGS